MNRRQRLENWIETLDSETIKKLAIVCIDELIDAEVINFYESTKVPYWDGSGNYIDGSKFDD